MLIPGTHGSNIGVVIHSTGSGSGNGNGSSNNKGKLINPESLARNQPNDLSRGDHWALGSKEGESTTLLHDEDHHMLFLTKLSTS